MTWMRRGDCSAVFSLEILRRIPCTGEESAPREIGRGIQQISKQTDAAFRSRNTTAPRNGIFIQIPQGLARRGFKNQNPARGRKPQLGGDYKGNMGFKNQNPARGRKPSATKKFASCGFNLRTRTPQGDGNHLRLCVLSRSRNNLRTRTPQGDGNTDSA